ncbi:MAG: hypothetical protein MJZ17_00935 [Bacteroidales bacterium]|nr:hypothetical protein [Bacteroidales bacterium]
MKYYIFVTSSIKGVGGNQCYIAAKARYLEDNGWGIHVFNPTYHSKKIKCPIEYMNKYLDDTIETLGVSPYKNPQILVNWTLKKMVKRLGPVETDDEIIVESHDDTSSQWAELFASLVHARHYIYLMTEVYRGKGKSYLEKMPFYEFKYQRKEILGCLMTFNRLFEGIRTISANDIPGSLVLNEAPVQDIPNEKICAISRKDYNICYIGRGTKPYVQNIIQDVGLFAKNHKNNTVQLLIVGDCACHTNLISNIISDNDNFSCVELGLLHPIPLSLYQKVDVVIAGSGSARHSAEAGALVIVADPETKLSNGLLGYETLNSVFQDKDSVVSSFKDALERVLVDKCYIGKQNRFVPEPTVEECTRRNLYLYSFSDRSFNYYDSKELLKGRKDIFAVFRALANNYFPFIVSFLLRFKQ